MSSKGTAYVSTRQEGTCQRCGHAIRTGESFVEETADGGKTVQRWHSGCYTAQLDDGDDEGRHAPRRFGRGAQPH